MLIAAGLAMLCVHQDRLLILLLLGALLTMIDEWLGLTRSQCHRLRFGPATLCHAKQHPYQQQDDQQQDEELFPAELQHGQPRCSESTVWLLLFMRR